MKKVTVRGVLRRCFGYYLSAAHAVLENLRVSILFWKDYVSGNSGIDPLPRGCLLPRARKHDFCSREDEAVENMSSKRKYPGGEREGRNGAAGGRRKVRFQRKDESEGGTQKKK